MSNVHIATANEVAGALPLHRHRHRLQAWISAIETLNEARTRPSRTSMWSRTFSGMEIVTNPTIHYMVSLEVVNEANELTLSNDLISALKQAARLTSDPISNAASNISVTVNNAELTVTPDKESRIITTTYPDEPSPQHQRCHYGLNQLDQFADARYRDFADVPHDDVEKQHNTNSLRENYPKRIYYRTGNTNYTLLTENLTTANVSHIKFVWDVTSRSPTLTSGTTRCATTPSSTCATSTARSTSTARTSWSNWHQRSTSGKSSVNTFLEGSTTSTQLLLKDQDVGSTPGIDPTLIFDLITPSVPLPFHLGQAAQGAAHHDVDCHATSLNMDQVRSGNIQLSQVPDMIYVFLRSNKMDSYALGRTGP